MDKVQTLPTIDDVCATRDLQFVARQLPLFSGNGTENLACGQCGRLIAANVSVNALYKNLEGHERVVVTCVCGAQNLLLTERRNGRR